MYIQYKFRPPHKKETLNIINAWYLDLEYITSKQDKHKINEKLRI